MFSINVDWQEAFQNGDWDFIGQRITYTEEELDDNPDLGIPMMNYAYPIYNFDGDEEKIKKVCQETNCTVVYNQEEDEYYLALTGGGMDLSQDIAYAYMIISGYIEWDFLDEVKLTQCLSVSEETYREILRQAFKQYKNQKARADLNLNEIKSYIKESLERTKKEENERAQKL